MSTEVLCPNPLGDSSLPSDSASRNMQEAAWGPWLNVRVQGCTMIFYVPYKDLMSCILMLIIHFTMNVQSW